MGTFPLYDAALKGIATLVVLYMLGWIVWLVFLNEKNPFRGKNIFKKRPAPKEPLWVEPEYRPDPWVVDTIEKLARGEITKNDLTTEQQAQIASELDQFFYQWVSSYALLPVSYKEAYDADAALKK